MPLFLIEKDSISDYKEIGFVQQYSDTIVAFISSDIPSTINPQRKLLWEEIKKQHAELDLSKYYILPICMNEFYEVVLGLCGDEIFDRIKPVSPISDELNSLPMDDPRKKEAQDVAKSDREGEMRGKLKSLFEYLKEKTTYVYIPKDIEPERFVVFETEEIQHLIGTSLLDVVKEQLKASSILTISTKLKEFVQNLSNTLPGYEFRMKGARQMNLNNKDIYSLIIHDFFSKRELFQKNNSNKDIPLSQMSSGEKQQAIISFIHSIVSNYRKNNNDLIVALDEPESALHISLCYEQFEKLYEISQRCCQVIFSSHWYGFIPTIATGSIANIVKVNDKHSAILFNIYRYREEIKQGIAQSMGKIPIDITLKGINDFIQSIISSAIRPNSYNWLICEGTSDKIYLEAYLSEELEKRKLRIVPVGGAKEVRRIYEHLYLAFEDLRNELKGKVFLLVDSDNAFLDFETKDSFQQLSCKRIVNDNTKKETILVNNQFNIKKKTDIEDALNGKLFHQTLLEFRTKHSELSFMTEEEKEEIPSYYAMNLRIDEYDKLDQFFSKDNCENKVAFARLYVEKMKRGVFKAPQWIEEIKKFFG